VQASKASGEADVDANPYGGDQATGGEQGRSDGSAPRAFQQRSAAIALACALSSGVCFSVSTVYAQRAFDARLPVVVVAGARPVIGCVLLFIVTAIAGRQAIAGRIKLRLMGVGLLTAAQIFLLYQSVERISASLAVLLLYSYPALVAVLSRLILHERLGPLKLVAVASSLAGAVLIVGVPTSRGTVIGFACGLGAGLSLAVYIVLASAVSRGIGPLTAVAWIQFGAAIAYLPGLAVVGRIGMGAVGWLMPVGLAAGVATALFLTSVQRLGPTTASIASTVEPISTAVLSAAVLGVRLTPTQAYGGLLILAALILISLDGARSRRATLSSP
jgi:drug/metabolite transporter (DMT)-like permease